MSLRGDFNNYYSGTYVAFSEGGINYPLFVEEVFQSGDFSDRDYSHEAEQGLQFRTVKWSKNDNGTYNHESFRISVFDPRIIPESPDVGYLLHSQNTVSWTQINPVRQRSKGLLGNKVRVLGNSGRAIQGNLVYDLFNPNFEGLLTRYIYIHPYTGDIYYKGCHVGKVDLEASLVRGLRPCTLLNKFKHIQPDFEERYIVTLVEAL